MKKRKAWMTNTAQSLKLCNAGIDVYTADIVNNYFGGEHVDSYRRFYNLPEYVRAVPGWTLGSLIELMPTGRLLFIQEENRNSYQFVCQAEGIKLTGFYDNMIDAAVEMLCSLLDAGVIAKTDTWEQVKLGWKTRWEAEK